MKSKLLTFFLLLSTSLVEAQNILPQALLEKCFEVTHEKITGGKFKGQVLKGKRNGMGFVLYKGGDLFAGDFYMDDITGMGMLVASGEIKNCDGCKIYVGNWQGGKKKGFGRCYSAEGNIIYQGQFADDKPTGSYPSENINQQRSIAAIQLNDGNIFVGEIKEGRPNGFGVVVFSNGDLWQSSFSNGERKGIGLYQAYDGEWQTMNVKGEQCSVVSSSENYRIAENARKEMANEAFSSIMESAVDVAKASAAMVAEFRKEKEEKERKEREAAAAAAAASNAANGSTYVVGGNTVVTYEDTNTSSGNVSSNSHNRPQRCPVCAGNGNCSGKNRCHGTKKCSYCQGDSYNYASGHRYKCEVCRGTGKCKYCNGTGKCSSCHGTGNKS